MNLDTCRFVVWGYKDRYHTHSHIHAAFHRALLGMGKDARWLDRSDLAANPDFSETFFISEHDAAKDGMPMRDDCFYVVHGMSDDAELRERMARVPMRLSWNVYHDFSHSHGAGSGGLGPLPRPVDTDGAFALDEDFVFYPRERHMDFRWATDLLPSEIEQNKRGASLLRHDSNVIWWIGTTWFVNEKELSAFARACGDAHVAFRPIGAGQRGVVSIEENIRLVRESHFAPAIVGTHHVTEGYAPCRIFKNISYGRYGVTNSSRVNDIFGGKLVYNPDPYKLFFEARERLASMEMGDLHALMDEVAAKHTYVNRISGIMKAARFAMEG